MGGEVTSTPSANACGEETLAAKEQTVGKIIKGLIWNAIKNKHVFLCCGGKASVAVSERTRSEER